MLVNFKEGGGQLLFRKGKSEDLTKLCNYTFKVILWRKCPLSTFLSNGWSWQVWSSPCSVGNCCVALEANICNHQPSWRTLVCCRHTPISDVGRQSTFQRKIQLMAHTNHLKRCRWKCDWNRTKRELILWNFYLSINIKHPKENESLGLPGNEILEKVKLFYRQKGGGSFSI